MNLAACDGEWTTVTVSTSLLSQAEVVSCNGTLQIVDGGGFGLPPLTYSDANALLVAIGALFALVWVIRLIGQIIR